jgi:hypothetical protein
MGGGTSDAHTHISQPTRQALVAADEHCAARGTLPVPAEQRPLWLVVVGDTHTRTHMQQQQS